jgi:hypothetical protein
LFTLKHEGYWDEVVERDDEEELGPEELQRVRNQKVKRRQCET